jgi:tetratricopeptide (TPR) repeat protein
LNDNNNIAIVLRRMGEIQMNKLHNYADAIKLFLDALELLRSEGDDGSGDEEQSILGLLPIIGEAYALAKDYENALDFFEEHIKGVESATPVNEALVAESLYAMGVIFANMDENNDYELAIEKLEECWNIKKELFGPDDERVADVVYTIATVYEKEENIDKAVELLSIALRTYKMKRNKHDTSKTYHALAKLKASSSAKSGVELDHIAALECYEEAIKERRKVAVLNDIVLASMLYEYATILCAKSDYDTAMPLLEEALRIQKVKKGLKDDQVANILLRTAEVHIHNGKYDASLVSLEQVLFIHNALGEAVDIDLGLCHHLLSSTYLARGDYEKAVESSLESLKWKRDEFGHNSLECASVHNNLGKAYGKLNEFDKAIESLVEGKLSRYQELPVLLYYLVAQSKSHMVSSVLALRIRKIELGNDSLEYGDTVLSLAELHVAMGKHSQALNCLVEAIRVFEMFPEVDINQVVEAMEMKGDAHSSLKDYDDAAASYRECIDIYEDSSDVSASEEYVATLNHKLGKALASIHEYDEAFAAYRVSIKKFSSALGTDNLRVADVMHDVGLLTLGDGAIEKAVQCFNETTRIYTLHGEQNSTKVADTLVQLGTIHTDQSENDEAMQVFEKAIKLYKEKLGGDAVEIGRALLLVGRLHDIRGEYDKSMSSFTEALRTFKSSLSEDDMSISLALSNIGIVHSRRKEYSDAVEMCIEALRIRKIHTENDEDVADSLFNIGNIYDEWGKQDDALPYFEGALKLYRLLLGDEDITVANCQQRLGAIYWVQKKVEKSLDSFCIALSICEKVVDDVEHLLLPIYKGLGDCYFSQEEYDKALDNFAFCLKIQKTELGDDSIEMATTCNIIGLIYQKKEKPLESINFHIKALQIYEKHRDKGSKECIFSHIQLSKALLASGQCDNSISRLRECLAVYSKDGDENREEIAAVYHQLGIAQNKLVEYEEAIDSLNKALDIRIRVFGKADAKVAVTLLDLGKVLQEWGDLDEVSNWML